MSGQWERRAVAGLGSAVVVLLVGGCSLIGGAGGGDASASGHAGHTMPPAQTSASAPASASPSASPKPVGNYHFQSGLGTIACVMGNHGVTCEVKSPTFKPPTKPASCQGTWGHAMSVGPRGGSFACLDEPLLGVGKKVAYNTVVRNFGYVCTVVTTKITCLNAKGKGFTLAAQGAKVVS